ncbi:hypothetical protein BU24DRAFT_436283 [Aaosphaeria arxii CBS 175.79]|uniref:Protein BNI4 n=1 Tax=Aaosphaeria arxii CBS 175.79 TaxID=1450172 RepID=A0A6A5XD59_9PLEO|nr:uncharacterized protein BU24DRAFT_436283 [Aaosphaeria arxii CBS 175.79]KAF2010928.1 hypothetical protein BU24DRAFT_436283 [Aaosphaeria arxii CBS 175.79]
MLHTSSDAFANQSVQQPHPQQPRNSQMNRSSVYNGQTGGTGYRGTSSAPIAPYAFSSTPQLRQENRIVSAPTHQFSAGARLGHPSHPSSSSDSTVSTSGSSSRSSTGPHFSSKDDSVLATSEHRKDTSTSSITLSTSVPDLSLSLQDSNPAKPSPSRYRASARRTDSSNTITAGSAAATPTQLSPSIGGPPVLASPKIDVGPIMALDDLQAPTRPGHNRASSVDDMQVPRQASTDQAKRYRRRSLSGLDATAQASSGASPAPLEAPISNPNKRNTPELRPVSSSNQKGSRPTSRQSHERQGSAGSGSSSVSRPSSRQGSISQGPVSPRTATEPVKRTIAPSPLSQSGSTVPAKKGADAPAERSPAMQHLTALNDKESGRGVKSRLRRAFSFGSAAELRRATAENNLSAERAKLRKDRFDNEQDAEQAAIVAKQEAAGIGAGIYNGQGGFSGSTDNLSISSTASSASIMLRKMGSGMRKGGRSIKGLFRPKSVIGVPAADGPIAQPSVGPVTMVSVEAERQKVNVNVDPREQAGGGTGYPKLERNSMEPGQTPLDIPSFSSGPNEFSRKSIVGGDRERAEVLSSIKKGILKRTGPNSETSSPVLRPVDAHHSNETPKSSAPSTPHDEQSRQAPIGGDDYFGRPPRIMSPSTRSLPTTPQGGRGNISFSPRIQFYDAWSASDYDRRGEIATCNRLTPMLAQQIKEELNTFKMEMEVHELSKPHTHFF